MSKYIVQIYIVNARGNITNIVVWQQCQDDSGRYECIYDDGNHQFTALGAKLGVRALNTAKPVKKEYDNFSELLSDYPEVMI